MLSQEPQRNYKTAEDWLVDPVAIAHLDEIGVPEEQRLEFIKSLLTIIQSVFDMERIPLDF